MKRKTINHIVRTAVTEFINQTENRMAAHPSYSEKYFVWIDITFTRKEALKISARRIEKTWDLTEINLKNGQTSGNYLMTCNVGDIYKSNNKKDYLECLSIN